jgi:hypothetical protein
MVTANKPSIATSLRKYNRDMVDALPSPQKKQESGKKASDARYKKTPVTVARDSTATRTNTRHYAIFVERRAHLATTPLVRLAKSASLYSAKANPSTRKAAFAPQKNPITDAQTKAMPVTTQNNAAKTICFAQEASVANHVILCRKQTTDAQPIRTGVPVGTGSQDKPPSACQTPHHAKTTATALRTSSVTTASASHPESQQLSNYVLQTQNA